MANGLQLNGSGAKVTLPKLGVNLHTIEFRVKTPTAISASVGSAAIFSTASANYWMYIGGCTSVLSNEVLTVRTDNTTGRAGYCDAAFTIDTGFHLYSYVFPYTGNPFIYIDGVLKPTTMNGTIPVLPFLEDMYLGVDSSLVLSEVRLFSYPRSHEQIAGNAPYRLKGHEKGLIFYSVFDEGSGGIVYDRSPIANHGIISKGTWVTTAPDLALPIQMVGGV